MTKNLKLVKLTKGLEDIIRTNSMQGRISKYPSLHRTCVLRDDKYHMVMWKQNTSWMDLSDVKARVHHLETVKERV